MKTKEVEESFCGRITVSLLIRLHTKDEAYEYENALMLCLIPGEVE